MDGISPESRVMFDYCHARLLRVRHHNSTLEAFYEAKYHVRDLGISTPPKMRHLRTVTGWPGAVVDCVDERLDFQGWLGRDDDLGRRLRELYQANCLDSESSRVHLDALIFGIGFAAVSRGGAGEPDSLVLGLSPKDTTGVWNPRTRRLDAALTVTERGESGPVGWTFWDGAYRYRLVADGGGVVVADAARHGFGRVPVVAFPNRARTSKPYGRSEITPAVVYYTEAAARTLLGLEINREFYNTPQRVGLNMPDEAFQDASGHPVNPWTAILGRLWTLPPNPNPDAPNPEVHQFQPSSPAPYLDQIRGYQAMVAAEAGLPEGYLGLHTANPASADAIRALESRFVRRVQRRQVAFGRAWDEVAALALGLPAVADFGALWAPAATQTLAADADAIAKLVGAGTFAPDSEVALTWLRLSPEQQERIRAENVRHAQEAQANEFLSAVFANGDIPLAERRPVEG